MDEPTTDRLRKARTGATLSPVGLARLLPILALVACSSGPRLSLAEAPIRLETPSVVGLGEWKLPVVEVALDGRTLTFLVDCGAAMSMIDPARAREIGLDVRPLEWSTVTVGSGGRSTVVDRYVPLERLELGGLVVERTYLCVLDDEVLRGPAFGGILAQDLLARLPVVIDMESGALHLLPPASDRAAIRTYLHEAELGDGAWAVIDTEFRPSPFLPLDTRGALESPVEVEIDTGATDTSLPEELIAALALPETEAPEIELRGVGGTRSSKAYRLEGFGLFGFRISAEIRSNPLAYGLLGMDVLGEFVFVLDGPGRALWLHHREVEPDVSGAR